MTGFDPYGGGYDPYGGGYDPYGGVYDPYGGGGYDLYGGYDPGALPHLAHRKEVTVAAARTGASEELRRFLVEMAVDPEKLAAFFKEPTKAMGAARLSLEDQAALRSGDQSAIHARLAEVIMHDTASSSYSYGHFPAHRHGWWGVAYGTSDTPYNGRQWVPSWVPHPYPAHQVAAAWQASNLYTLYANAYCPYATGFGPTDIPGYGRC